MTLFSTNTDRSLIYWLLKTLFSMTSLEQHLFISRKILKDVEDQLRPIIASTELKINSLNKEADKHVELMKHNLKASIDKDEKLLEQKRERLSQNLISDKEFDTENKRQRLESLEQNSKRFKFQYTYRKLGKWRSSIRSSFEKNKGKYRINRVAEDAIYQRFAEHAKAHHRRHGELNTSYLDEDPQRLQNREMPGLKMMHLNSLIVVQYNPKKLSELLPSQGINVQYRQSNTEANRCGLIQNLKKR